VAAKFVKCPKSYYTEQFEKYGYIRDKYDTTYNTPTPYDPSLVKPVIRPPTVKFVIRPPTNKSVIRPPAIKSVIRPPTVKSVIRPPTVKSVIRPPTNKSVIRPPTKKEALLCGPNRPSPLSPACWSVVTLAYISQKHAHTA